MRDQRKSYVVESMMCGGITSAEESGNIGQLFLYQSAPDYRLGAPQGHSPIIRTDFEDYGRQARPKPAQIGEIPQFYLTRHLQGGNGLTLAQP